MTSNGIHKLNTPVGAQVRKMYTTLAYFAIAKVSFLCNVCKNALACPVTVRSRDHGQRKYMTDKIHQSFPQNSARPYARPRSASHGMQKRQYAKSAGRFNFSIRPQKPNVVTSRVPGNTKIPALFPQKPPYRPGTPNRNTAPSGKTLYRKFPQKFVPTSSKSGASVRTKPKTQLAKYAPHSARATASWGSVATWYDKHLEHPDTYHEKVILPNLQRLVEAKNGDLILDLASGQGFFTRALAKSGAQLTGIDISHELIAIAKKKSDAKISYNVGSAEDLSVFANEHFAKVVIVLAIQNIEHIQKVFAEAARVLKRDGSLHIVMNHPAFRIPKRSSWVYDEKAKLQYRRVDQYLSESREAIDMHPGMKDSPQTVSFHRPLQYYVKALVKAGFVIDRFEEWISHKDSDSGPRAKAENRARKEIPLFLYVRAKKKANLTLNPNTLKLESYGKL